MILNKRKLFSAVLAITAVLTLASCGKKEETAPPSLGKDAPKTTEPLKVGFIYVGPVGMQGGHLLTTMVVSILKLSLVTKLKLRL
jgi:predicted small lipoprotein YifL